MPKGGPTVKAGHSIQSVAQWQKMGSTCKTCHCEEAIIYFSPINVNMELVLPSS